MTITSPCLVLSAVVVILTGHVTHGRYWRPSALMNPSETVCLAYMNRCVPWTNKCCDGLSCTNLRKGFCVYPLEICVCQLKDSYNVDQDSYDYK